MRDARSIVFGLSQSVIPVTNCDRFDNLKHLGKKWFAFAKMDVSAIEMLQRVKI